MRLYLIRHGEAVSNRDRIYGGQGQLPLTEKGRLEAERLRPLLNGIHFDRIYSSDLIRAMDTLDIALPNHPEAVITPLIRERNVGSLTWKKLSELSEEDRAIIKNEGFKPFGGESLDELKERIKAFLSEIEKLPENETIAAFSHQGILVHALAVIFNADISWQNVICQNCAVLVLNYNGEIWSLEGLLNIKDNILNYEQV